MLVSASEDTMDLITEMAALGLPTSFQSRSAIQEKGSKRPSESSILKSESKEAVEAEPVAPVLFSVRSVQLFSAKEHGPEEITLDRLEGLVYDCQAMEDETVLAGPEHRILNHDQGDGLDGVELACEFEDKSDKQINPESRGDEVARYAAAVWEPVWDEQYQRYYFCNTQSWESTWDPPPGLEHFGVGSMAWSECNSADQSQVAHHSETSCVLPASILTFESSCEASGTVDMDKKLSSDVDQVEADDVHAHDTSAVVLQDEDVIEPVGCEKASALETSFRKLSQENETPERLPSSDVAMEDECGPVAEGEPPSSSDCLTSCASPAKSGVVNKLEEVIIQVSAAESSTMTEGENHSVESLPVFPQACGVHTRFIDSEDSGTEAEDDEETNWGEIEERQSAPNTCEDETEAWSLCFKNGTIESTESLVQLSGQRVKRRRVKSLSESEKLEKVLLPGMAETMSKSLIKYWLQRYSLFSKYDEGIKLDEEGWFSVTPEVIAEHQALRCPTGLVIDAFTGVGGNAIQFALKKNYVVAIDIDPTKVELARHNAEIYGVSDSIDFIVGDFFLLAPSLKADFVFLSPPWGGPEYLNQEIYNIETMLQPTDGFTLFKIAQTIAPNLAMFLPRNVDMDQLQELSWLSSPPLPCQVEKNYVDHRLKAITAYYGELVGQKQE
ncbi:trimethylguanosine synthase [Marchantia polymorpha subsp. ruderalis]|uniref:Trimethylguanosine synthase n=2 Tax=Marchantia polymorpha TaxID=3197 RepID=A0AAF6C0Y9_MARPO|nr:hypothetical protein MARPO_0102s0034 [Marchantia polymorpha]BBN17923.1 hypothetical protein Mp_7g18060 [Marchantia polymorpha subsp. ruderalis]|eukprot:PTQ32166.1 hypothetical protein MARPO_0102s0034 [Marchantia polymorpha]